MKKTYYRAVDGRRRCPICEEWKSVGRQYFYKGNTVCIECARKKMRTKSEGGYTSLAEEDAKWCKENPLDRVSVESFYYDMLEQGLIIK